MQVHILKAVFERGDRKWQFLWDGAKVSAPIRDRSFFDRLENREIYFTQGDSLDVDLEIVQAQDDTGYWSNISYEVLHVYEVIHAPRQSRLFEGFGED